MGYGPWAMGFNLCAARHYVLIGAARLAAEGGKSRAQREAPMAPIKTKSSP